MTTPTKGSAMLYNYRLEIYSPDKTDEVLVAYESDRPFPTIQVGDLLCPEDARQHQKEHGHVSKPLPPRTGLVALKVRHNFWRRDETNSLIWFTAIYTTAVPITPDVLLGESGAGGAPQ